MVERPPSPENATIELCGISIEGGVYKLLTEKTRLTLARLDNLYTAFNSRDLEQSTSDDKFHTAKVWFDFTIAGLSRACNLRIRLDSKKHSIQNSIAALDNDLMFVEFLLDAQFINPVYKYYLVSVMGYSIPKDFGWQRESQKAKSVVYKILLYQELYELWKNTINKNLQHSASQLPNDIKLILNVIFVDYDKRIEEIKYALFHSTTRTKKEFYAMLTAAISGIDIRNLLN